jgi:UDPglucose 6-dehydrogenase
VNPEFLREATAAADFASPRVIVIGALDERSDRALRGLYGPWHDVPIVSMDLRTAEATKYAANLFNAAKISFFNELDRFLTALGVDAPAAFAAAAQGAEGLWSPVYGTRRLGPFAGACLPKDAFAFLDFAQRLGFIESMPMLRAAIAVNERLIVEEESKRREPVPDLLAPEARARLPAIALEPSSAAG